MNTIDQSAIYSTCQLPPASRAPSRAWRIGVISDTHGLLRPSALVALQGVDHILHAGDIGDPAILTELGKIAPVTAIRGNTDHGPWAKTMPDTEVATFDDSSFYIIHDLNDLNLDPRAGRFSGVITGHTHKPVAQDRNGVLYLNPGSAGPKRFELPTTVAIMLWNDQGLKVEILDLDRISKV